MSFIKPAPITDAPILGNEPEEEEQMKIVKMVQESYISTRPQPSQSRFDTYTKTCTGKVISYLILTAHTKTCTGKVISYLILTARLGRCSSMVMVMDS
ncbi:UNVERIFIED_CONTAM: hypothetical protein NCL1_15364 [Trichonephila clavipes]